MRRRDILQALAGAMLAAPGAAAADTSTKVYRVGTLTVGPPIPPTAGTGAMLVDGLAQRGFKLGQNLAYEARGAAGKVSQTANLMQELKAANIDPKDVQTSRLSLQPQYAPNHNPPTVTGYRASNQVSVRLHDITKIASTIDALVSAGATDIGGINFTVSNASKLLDDARMQALADAHRKAEIYAKAAGVALGTPLSISEDGIAPIPIFRAKMAAAPMAATPVAPGQETLSVTVHASWAIKQGQQ